MAERNSLPNDNNFPNREIDESLYWELSVGRFAKGIHIHLSHSGSVSFEKGRIGSTLGNWYGYRVKDGEQTQVMGT